MYDYCDIYEKITKNTESVNLPCEESVKIVDKIYRDLEMGLLKPRNINNKSQKLIENSLERIYKQKENLTFENYQVEAFIEKIKPKVIMSDEELRQLKNKLSQLEKINEISLNNALNDFLKETNNNSFKMVKNQNFRDFNQAIVSIENPKLANKHGLYDKNLMFYTYIDHDDGILFELLSNTKNEVKIFKKEELNNEIIKFIDRDELKTDKYDEIRNLTFLDEFRDSNNPDIVTVKFIESHHIEYLKVKLESIIGSKFIGTLIEKPKKIKCFYKNCDVVVSYCYDYSDKLHLYVEENNLSDILKSLSKEFETPSKRIIVEKLSDYKNQKDFNIIFDAFHSIIFDYFKDFNDFVIEMECN